MVIEVVINPGEEHKAFDALRAIAEKLAPLDARISKSLMHMDDICNVAEMPDASKTALAELDAYLDWT